MKKLCIFDLDGTILDTVGSIAYYGNLALEQNGIAPIERDEYRFLAGDGARVLVHRMLHRRGCDGGETFERVFRDYNEAYNEHPTYLTRIFDGLREALNRMKAHGVRMTVFSNKPDYAVQEVTRALWGEDYFECVIGQREGVPLKPDPTVVFEILEKTGVSPADCVYIGDTSTDMRTGRNAGLFTVGVLWGFRDIEELLSTGADAVARTPEELYTLVMEDVVKL